MRERYLARDRHSGVEVRGAEPRPQAGRYARRPRAGARRRSCAPGSAPSTTRRVVGARGDRARLHAVPLHKARTQTVFGVGRRDAQLFVIGEAPGADEDRQGEPFVGRAGQLLNAMLHAIGLPRSDVLHREHLEVPAAEQSRSAAGGVRVVHALPVAADRARAAARDCSPSAGSSAQWLLQTDAPSVGCGAASISYGERNTPLVVTYHPAYLLRSPLAKATAWTDLCLVKELLSQSIDERRRPSAYRDSPDAAGRLEVGGGRRAGGV